MTEATGRVDGNHVLGIVAGDFDGVAPQDRALAETLNGVHSNAEGFRRWLAQRGTPGAPAAGGHAHPHPHPHPPA